LDHTIVDEFFARIVAEVADLIYALVVVKLAANVMKYAANPTFSRHDETDPRPAFELVVRAALA
jgi:hypothetical protein